MSVRDLIILGTSSQQPTRKRNHGAYLFRWNDEGLLFDPGEGTQRQFIFANVAPPCVTRIFVSHFHGDHCLGLGSMLMRLNLDKVTHPIHVYYPASGKKYFDRLRYGTAYHEAITVVEHPVSEAGLVEDDGKFLTDVHGYLKPGGFLYLTVPAYKWLWSRSDIDAGHFRRYDPEELVCKLNEHFNVLFNTCIFRALVFPVLAFRVVPYRLGFAKSSNVLTTGKEHGTSGGFQFNLIKRLLSTEPGQILSGKSKFRGTSCLCVAKKN